jgi:hypothetical protein
MRAISLWQPWASLVVAGKKRIETRSWQTSYRGRLAIHAAKKWDAALAKLCQSEPLGTLLDPEGKLVFNARVCPLPTGAIVGTVEVAECVRVEDLCQHPLLSELERKLGDYRPGRWLWLLAEATPLVVPAACKGTQGMFEIADRMLECPGHERGGQGKACCERAGEYNGFGSDGPLLFSCPKGCGCHD